jgi:hypothetical protein
VSSQGLIILLFFVAVILISIVIAWVSYCLSNRRGMTVSGEEPIHAPLWLIKLLKRFTKYSQIFNTPAGPNKIKIPPIFRRKSSGLASVHFHFELSEGEKVCVIAEGEPGMATKGLVSQEVIQETLPSQGIPNVETEPVELTAPISAPPEVGQVLEKVSIERAISRSESVALPAEVTQAIPEKPQLPIIKLILVLASVLFALQASTLVILDRWRGVNLTSESLGKLWNSIAIFRQLVYPPYFIFVFVAVIGIFWVLWQARGTVFDFATPKLSDHQNGSAPIALSKQVKISRIMLVIGDLLIAFAFLLQIKTREVNGLLFLLGMLSFFLGWGMREVDLSSVWSIVSQNWKPAAAFIVFHVFLVKCLSSFYSNKHLLWLWITLAVITLAFTLFQYRKRIPIILWVMSLALVLYTIRINGWEFSVIGDEYSFFMYAQELARRHDLLFSINKLFNGLAVFGTHPFFSSFLQMISVRLFTGSNFGWRFSAIYLSSLSLVFFYLFFRSFIKPRLALLAVMLLAVSHYIMTFGKIGYNNLQSYFILSLVLVTGAWAVRSRTTVAYIALGISLGACFYVYPAALYALPIGYLLLLFFDAPFTYQALKRWASTLISFGVLILPLILQNDYWSTKIPGTIFYTPELMASTSSLLSHFANNMLYAFLSFLYIPQEGHFVVSSYLDPLSGAFALLGLAYLLTRGLKERFVQFFLVGYIAMLFFVGASHGSSYPPNTRMFLLLPWLALLAAVGIEWLAKQVKVTPPRRVWMDGMFSVLLVGILTLNLYQAYSLSKQRSIGLQSAAMLFVRVLERIQAQKSTIQHPLTIWFLTVPPWGIDGYRLFLTTYDIPESTVRLEKIDVDGSQLPEGVTEKVQAQDSMVIIYPDLEPGLQEALGNTLVGLGKQPCPVKTMSGVTRFVLWYSQPLEWVCEQGD